MQKTNNPPASATTQQQQSGEKLSSASGACSPTGAQTFSEQRAGRNVAPSPEAHVFRPVVLANFGTAADANGTAPEFCSEDSSYSANLSGSFRTWEHARRAQPTASAVFPSSFDSNALSREFFRSTAESLYAQFDPTTFGLPRAAAGGNLQTCVSPASFESPFEALVSTQNTPSSAFCALSGGEHYATFPSHQNNAASTHFIAASNMLNLPSTSQLQYGASTYSSVFGGFGGAQQAARGANSGWQAATSNGNVTAGNVSNQNVGDSSSHDHNMNATTYQLFCNANNVDAARATVLDQLGGPLQVSGLPVTSRLEDGAYIVSIVQHDPAGVTGAGAVGSIDDSKVMAQLTSGVQQIADLDYDPRELEQFAEKFKQRRIKLGVTQSDVGKMLDQLKIPGVGPLSQSTICRFESLTLSHNNMIALKPVLQAWLDYAEMQALEKLKNCNDQANGCSQSGQNDRKRKRTSITDSEKRALEAYFAVQPRPSSEKIAQIADKLNLKKNVVRVWFCNQRQKQKRMKFANQAAGMSDAATNSPTAADSSQNS